MPPSQLKRLKSSLREQGITGPQKSKKQKKQASKNGAFRDIRIQRNAALEGIREQFNPFEIRIPARPSKHDVASSKNLTGKGAKGAVARPGTTKGFGEEQRRQTLLKEMQRRKKVGGILDRRFGENDPTMTPEEKALSRFVKEKQRGSRNDTLFDLEDGDEEGQLTHFGQSLSFDKPTRIDDFQQVNLTSEEESDGAESLGRPNKRRKLSSEAESDEERLVSKGADQAGRPKSKREVMSEVIAKSKLHKYERQRAKEDDDDLRAELDKGLPDLLAFMRGTQPPPLLPQQPEVTPNGNMNPDRAAMLNGKDRVQAEKEYDQRLNQMLFDKRSKPSERTLTEDEKLEKEAQRLKELEQERLRRMKGEPDSEEDEDDQDQAALEGDGDSAQEEQDAFGLGSGLSGQIDERPLGVEDEDEFVIEDDLLASDSALKALEEASEVGSVGEGTDEEDVEFVQGLITEHDAGTRELDLDGKRGPDGNTIPKALAYTYDCPQTHEGFIHITKNVPIGDQVTIIQRIRALHHPKLLAGNKAKLEIFSTILVDHIFYLANNSERPSFAALEALIRHIHSLARMFPEAVGRAFRKHISSLAENRPLDPNPGDLVILTAISSMFPTSDHFHQVVTPAMLCMGLYLAQKIPRRLSDLATGVYLSTLCFEYQRLSGRYVPELVNYVLNALWALAPVRPSTILGPFPQHSLPFSFRVRKGYVEVPRRLQFWDTIAPQNTPKEANEELKLALLNTAVAMCGVMADVWTGKPAFNEIFEPVAACLKHLTSKACITKIGERTGTKVQETLQQIQELLQQARKARKPLLLHNHRPHPIKTSIPKFEESFNPDKHYDPDRDRAEMNRLKAEHKKERKGALRELRKDANFIARESLREKKERDAQYDKKFKRLVAEIQGEEGREAKGYEREKRTRKGKR
ncbi:MAG: hypothetical protein LQ343_003201 [Gyalolechia ehrenbergii]|nr:MAG: hypothetical protein LQ343_003201 [Gyalolechia ehrenbergii]